jgi:hypothetical protein
MKSASMFHFTGVFIGDLAFSVFNGLRTGSSLKSSNNATLAQHRGFDNGRNGAPEPSKPVGRSARRRKEQVPDIRPARAIKNPEKDSPGFI